MVTLLILLNSPPDNLDPSAVFLRIARLGYSDRTNPTRDGPNKSALLLLAMTKNGEGGGMEVSVVLIEEPNRICEL